MPKLGFIYKMVSMACPTVREVHLPPSGFCRFICYISIRKRHEGEAKNAIGAAFGADPAIKYVIVVDDDVNIFDDEAVITAVSARLHADRDAFMIRRAMGNPLDPTLEEGLLVTKVGIDATKPLTGYPEPLRVPGVEKINLNDYF